MAIDRTLIEGLLNEEESSTLDFKREQYRFTKASDGEKSELLKDILAFANAWRHADAYILIGVEEVKGGRSIVRGVSEQLDDAQLQQFVNSKTQRPLTFSYVSVAHDGEQIGVIHIPVQERPIYPKAAFGHLKKNVVYTRRGSSTAEADPDEVARMGKHAVVQAVQPSLELQFAAEEGVTLLGSRCSLKSAILEISDPDEIPEYRPQPGSYATEFGTNRDYYRELAAFRQQMASIRGLRLAAINNGVVVATDVRMEITIPDPNGLYILFAEDDLPDEPAPNSLSVAPRVRGFHAPRPDVHVTKDEHLWSVRVKLGKIQPKATVRSNDKLYLGARQSCTVEFEAVIYDDGLIEPIRVPLRIEFTVERRSVTAADILRGRR